jgi:hypothetical protein
VAFPNFAAHGQGADDVSKRTATVEDDSPLSVTDALENKPCLEREPLIELPFETVNFTPAWPEKGKQRAGDD